ncbi:MAG: hypothetical protein HQL46_13890 [Gammaproteobacteria bacterium]|nr:hypothetical protein [Gammaproteobacteria bacterium]
MKKIEDENYCVTLDEDSAKVIMDGVLRLSGAAEFTPIVGFLNDLLALEEKDIEIDLSKLEFMNSSGIAVLSKLMISARQRKSGKITIRGSLSIPWQTKSLKNLQRLLPALELIIE